VDEVAEDFHARYSALNKSYIYRVVHSSVISPFWSRYAYQESRVLDLDRMRHCASLFIGEHDWTAFSAAQSDADSRVRNITVLDIADRWNGRGRCHLIEFTATANGFLRYMVRSIVGTLLAVGRGETDEETVAQAVSHGDRSLAGPTAPAHGLTLKGVEYKN